MSNDLQTDIAAAIKQHLPAQIGDALRKRLEHADAVVLRNEDLEKKFIQLEERLLNQVEQLKAAGNLDAREAAVQKRERDAAEAEIRREVFETKTKLEAEQRVASLMKEALLGLVRNTEYRSATTGSVPVVVPGYAQNGYNNPPFVGGGTVATSTNTEAG